MINGIHHISMKCRKEDVAKVKDFYITTLGMSICREWDDGLMIDTGGGLLEIFTTGEGEHGKGSIRHIALSTDNVDAVIESVKRSGYEVFIEPNDKVINSSPAFPFRMAFCYGPLGEQVEFFCEL